MGLGREPHPEEIASLRGGRLCQTREDNIRLLGVKATKEANVSKPPANHLPATGRSRDSRTYVGNLNKLWGCKGLPRVFENLVQRWLRLKPQHHLVCNVIFSRDSKGEPLLQAGSSGNPITHRSLFRCVYASTSWGLC